LRDRVETTRLDERFGLTSLDPEFNLAREATSRW
jgi:hypothetical protein